MSAISGGPTGRGYADGHLAWRPLILSMLTPDPGIGTHPVDLLTDGGEPVATVVFGVEVEKDQHDVGLCDVVMLDGGVGRYSRLAT